MAKLKLNNQLSKAICADIKAGAPMKHSAIAHGISERTFYDWYNKGKKAKSGRFKNFYDDVEEAKSQAILLRARRIYKAGNTTWQADAWWLERVAPKEFGRHDKLSLDGDLKHEHKNIKNLFNEELIDEILDEDNG